MVTTWEWGLSLPVCMAGAGLGLFLASKRKPVDCRTRMECLAAWLLWSYAAFFLNMGLDILWRMHGLSFYYIEDFIVSLAYAYLMADVKIFSYGQDGRSGRKRD